MGQYILMDIYNVNTVYECDYGHMANFYPLSYWQVGIT